MKKEATRAEEDLQLWQAWMDSGKNPDMLDPLLKRFQGLIMQQVHRYRLSHLPKEIITDIAKVRFTQGLGNYDPTREASVATFVSYHLKKLQSDVTAAQFKAPSAHRVGQIPVFKKTRDDLSDRFNREPTQHEIADAMSIPLAQVQHLEAESRPLTFGGQDIYASDTMGSDQESLQYAYYDIPHDRPDMKLVFESMTGYNGARVKRPVDIVADQARAGDRSWSPSRITRIKKEIDELVRLHEGARYG